MREGPAIRIFSPVIGGVDKSNTSQSVNHDRHAVGRIRQNIVGTTPRTSHAIQRAECRRPASTVEGGALNWRPGPSVRLIGRGTGIRLDRRAKSSGMPLR